MVRRQPKFYRARQDGGAINPAEMLRSALDAFTLAPGEVLFREGDEGDHMYVVLDGSVDIVVGDTVIESATRGVVLGEMAMIDDSPRSASAIASVASRLVAIDRNRFHLLVQRHPAFSTHVMKVLADRLRHMNQLFLAARGRERAGAEPKA
jgi:CRP/FNR family transcriptional regulator, cyclic AMP receptor protein